MRKQKFVAMAVLSLALAGVAFAVHDQRLFEHEVVQDVGTIVAEAALLGGAQTAFADTVDDVCMQDLAGFDLGCTANDVQIASATIISIDDPCQFPGDEVTFTAQFDVVVTAKERFDLGLYFAIDGDVPINGEPPDGAISGRCSVSNIDPDAVDQDGESQFVDLDGPPDTCGDITKKSNPLQPVITITTVCIDPDGDGNLNLPNCTSWRQSGANELCNSPLAAFPGSPSKCRCDIGFNVPVPVPPAVLRVEKDANPTTTGEPGGEVVFTVKVFNDAIDPTNEVTVNTVMDDVHGNVSSTCLDASGNSLVNQTIPANGGSLTCSFTATVFGDAGDSETDTVTVSGTDSNNVVISGFDDATVTITDELPTIDVTKDATPTQVGEGGELVTFTVEVFNTSVEPVTVTELTDSIHGNVGTSCRDTNGVLLVDQSIAVDGSLTCTFTATVGAGIPGSETDTVTATAEDNEGNSDSAADSAIVMINDVPSMLTLTKTPNPESVDEPGGDVTFTILVTNTSLVDEVTIDTLTDSIHGDLSAKCSPSLIGQVLEPNDSASCTFTEFIAGNGNTSETNTATVDGTDDDGQPVEAMGDATVNIDNVAPTAMLVKIATQATVTYEVSVTNASVSGDPLTVLNLNDNVYGDVADAANPDPRLSNNSCPLLKGSPIDPTETVTCTFDALVNADGNGEASVIDVVTGVLVDDELSAVTPAPSDTAHVILTQ